VPTWSGYELLESVQSPFPSEETLFLANKRHQKCHLTRYDWLNVESWDIATTSVNAFNLALEAAIGQDDRHTTAIQRTQKHADSTKLNS
jgi:hypothetical protein